MKNLRITGPGIVTIIDNKQFIKEAIVHIERSCAVCGCIYNPAYGDFQHYVGCPIKELEKTTQPQLSVKPPAPPSPPVPVVMGWMCPRCGRGNAPHVNTCSCKTLEVTC